MDDDSTPEFVASECSHPLTREDRRTFRRIIGRLALAVLIFLLVVLLALNAIAASMGYGSF